MSVPIIAPSLWTAYEAAAATGGSLAVIGPDGLEEGRGTADRWIASGISFDTRTLNPGDLFAAITGARDGHDFLGAAARAGAAAAVVSRIPADAPEGLPLLRVSDPMEALSDLAAAARDRNFGKLVAVTGSAGKTSTKEMLRAALGTCGSVHAALKSFNNHLGVPVSLATLPSRTAFGVFEIGMNHAGEITPLTGLVRPHVAIITTIAAAHLENFPSMDGIAAAKAEILSGIRLGGAAVLPADSPYAGFLAEEAAKAGVARMIPFGRSADSGEGVRLDSYAPAGDGGQMSATVAGTRVDVTLKVPGEHHASNACAVLGAGHALGLPLSMVVAGLESFAAGAGRGERHQLMIAGRQVAVIDESYNANPASMRAALSVLGRETPASGGRRLAVLGEMKELGPTAPALHAELAGPLAEAGVRDVFLAGEAMKALADALPSATARHWASEAGGLLDPLLRDLRDGDVILFKGSNASGVGALLSAFLAKAEKAG